MEGVFIIPGLSALLAGAAEVQPWYYGFLFKVLPFVLVLGLLIFVH